MFPAADTQGLRAAHDIDIPQIRGWIEGCGFAGYSEVEIFSAANWWQRDCAEVLDACIQRHRGAV